MNASQWARSALLLLLATILLGCGGREVLRTSRSGPVARVETVTAGSSSGFVPAPRFDQLDLRPQPSHRGAGLLASHEPAAQSATAAARHTSGAGFDPASLPPLPELGRARSASTAYTDQASVGSPAGAAPNVQPGLNKATFFSDTDEVSWAYYGVHTYATKTAVTATITGTMTNKANGFKSGIFLAVANYTTGRWQFFPNIYNLTGPAQVTFTPGDDYISPGDNVYLLIATWNGDWAEVTGIQFDGDDANVPPVAGMTISGDVAYAGGVATVDANSSSDSDLTITKYEFDFGEGAGFEDKGGTALVAHQYDTPGPFLVQVRVTDEGGLSAIAQQPVLIVDPASFLPLSWYRARLNGGLAFASMGAADIFGTGFVYPAFYFSGTADMRTKLPGYFDAWYAAPESFPATVDAAVPLLTTAGGIQPLLLEENSKYWSQHQIIAQTYNPTLDPSQPLAAAIATFVTNAGGTASQSTYQAALGSMALNQQQALARIFLAADSALARRKAAFTALGLDAATVQLLFDDAQGDPLGGLLCVDTGQYVPALWDVTSGNYVLSGFPYETAFFTGGAEIADALDQLRAFVAANNPVWPNVNLTVDTPAGQLKIGGTGADTHAAVVPDGHAVLIDLGGADTYNCHAGATASGLNGVSLCIDLGNGNDTYNRIDDPDNVDRTMNPSDDNTSQQGAARLGIGMLVDYGGNDHYHSVRMSQGACVIGVGVLDDMAGNDTYDMEALGQGAAFAGMALLLDEGGTDTFDGWNKVQGFGGIMGVGMLVSRGMAIDHYTAVVDADPLKPEYSGGASFNNKNFSFAQGAGLGCPLGLLTLNGQTVVGGGGYGLLSDRGGNEVYTCGLFGQGSGFYQSTGVLIDDAGGDTYTGAAYCQGAARNAGVAELYDVAGNDSYTTAFASGVGGADDWALAWLIDRGTGGDQYDAPDIGLGASTQNAFGYLVEWGGDDTYGSHVSGFENATLGKASLGAAARTADPGYGIFADDSGTDTYALEYSNMANASLGLPGDGAFWVRLVDGAYVNGHGSGVDN